jgi:hypothetical protein
MLNSDSVYYKQGRLLFLLLPLFEKVPELALKGGTAINLFVRNMPRISVDLDFTFVPILEREKTLESITKILKNITDLIPRKYQGISVFMRPFDHAGHVNKFIAGIAAEAQVKVEVSTVLRGTVFGYQKMEVLVRPKEHFVLSI